MVAYRLRKAAAAAALLALCSACAGPDPAKVIGPFATATQDASAAIKAYDEAAAQRLTEIGVAKVLSSANAGIAVVPMQDGCMSGSADCQLGYRLSKGADPKQLAFQTLIPETALIADDLSTYGGALSDLAAADSRDEVSAALGKASAAISSAANVVQPGSGPAAAAILGPSASGLSWLYGKYQDKIKADALRKATAAMNPVVAQAAAHFQLIADQAATADQAVAVGEFNEAQQTYQDAPNASTLRAYMKAAADLNAILKAPHVGKVFTSLAGAHDKLTDALDGEIESFAELQASVAQLAADAQTLRKLAEDFKKATQ
jgi:3-deoxy-D-manno-octulosonate 8-phosphate phosphatase KdsC-like HAD superfamily phosphatase